MSAETLITAAPTISSDHAAQARSRRTARRRRNRKKAKAIRLAADQCASKALKEGGSR